jgi:hypothetical protein
MSIIGALTGELFRAASTDINLLKFIANFMASSLLASILTLLIMEYTTKNKIVLTAIAAYSGYIGQKESSGFIKKILNSIVDTTSSNSKKAKK